MDRESSDRPRICHVVALPIPGRGHINPMMNLCKSLIAKKPDLLITFVVTEEWFGFIGGEPKPANLKFGIIPNVISSEIGRGKDSPGHYEEVLRKMKAPVEELLDQGLVLPTTAMIADTYYTWAVEIGNKRNILVASLWTMSAMVYSVFLHFDLLVQHHHFPIESLAERGDEQVDYIPGVPSTRIADLPTCFYGKGHTVLNRALEAISSVSKAHCLLLGSVYELETQVIEALKQHVAVPIYHIGPTIPYFKLQENDLSPESSIDTAHHFKWLDFQPKVSVLYVSQGSVHSVSSAQMDEIAAGLCLSGVRFFWVARDGSSRIKEISGDMGLVVPWCNQLRVLCHPSIGGFWSHCGWNSTSEAVFAGLPMLSVPIYWDQVSNTKMVVEDWKIGLRVIKKNLDAENLVGREEIAGLVQRFMDLESNEGKEMRRKAKELQKICLQAIQRGGSTDSNIEAFACDIS